MNPERYQQIDQLFQAALAQEPATRAAFLEKECRGGASLRQEVESLITSDERGLSFIDDPAFEMAASILASDEPALTAGDRVDRYEILSLLGSGGMGEVYLAHDEKLDRKIALKLLPFRLITNQQQLRRFQQEARVASGLNHPNIITIHEIGEMDDRHYIATEFVEGETLRQRLNRGPMSVDDSLEIAIQVGSALAAAHQAGIIHRDIKPENIMLRPDGYVKVLDFGLAKLKQQSETTMAAQVSADVDASSGLVMGTVKYMSPEQAQGDSVDQRSDLFSLGVVFYEMLTGRAPFNGKGSREIVESILADEPPALLNGVADAPEGLPRVVSKLLQKHTAQRYENAEDLLTDLRSLKEARVSILTHAVTRIQDHKLGASMLLVALAMIAVLAGLALFNFLKPRSVPFAKINVTKLTNFDDAWWPSISPDGKYIAYVKGTTSTGPEKTSLWLKTLGTTNDVALVPMLDGRITFTRFFPDGRIGYQTAGGAFVIPTSGGTPTKLAQKGISFSPDGKRVAYLDSRLPEGKTALVVAKSDGTDLRDITTRQAPNYYYTAIRPSWSADGRLIGCVGQNGTESFPHVFVIEIASGKETTMTAQKWTAMTGLAWLPDMSGLLVAAAEETSSTLQIWEISYPGGEARRITNDTVNYGGLSLTADGKTLVTTKIEAATSIWIMPVDSAPAADGNDRRLAIDTSKAKQINVTNLTGVGGFEGYARLYWSPDGHRIFYMSEESGNADLWSMNSDGTDRRQLTTDQHWDTAPVVSPNGRLIAFMSNRAGAENIWLMDINGGSQRRLTSKLIERHPVFSADSKWVYFVSWQTGKATVWRIPVEGGQPTQVISELSFVPAISPDGRFLLYGAPAPGFPQGEIFITAAEGGPPLKTFQQRGVTYTWTPDGRALVFIAIKDNVANLWEQPLDGSEPRQLTGFTSDGISKYGFSPDGKELVVARSKYTSDVVMIADVR